MQTTTLAEIHRDPAILDRAIARHEALEIFQAGRLAARMVPEGAPPPAAAGAARPWSEIFNAEAHRAWLRETWGDRFRTFVVATGRRISSAFLPLG